MKSGPKYNMAKGRPDNFGTPEYALNPLVNFLKGDELIWECAAGEGLMAEGLLNRGFDVYETSIEKGFDFLIYEPKFNYDMIITNPPYQLKDQFLERCYELEKPFALLLPITCLEGRLRQCLYNGYGLELILPPKRVNFTTPIQKLSEGNGSSAFFYSAWFTWGLNLPKQLNFVMNWDLNE